MKHLQKTNLVFALILAAYAVYAAVYIYKTSFIVAGERFFMLFDDAMISMRYARNLASGYGLVWNPGDERVEGFTNPLWVVYMTLFHFIPFSVSKISLPIQISGALFFMASLYYVKKIAEEIIPSSLVSLLAVFLTAFYVQLSTWSLLGMEVSVLILMTCAAVWLALRVLRTGQFSTWLYLLLGIGTLVRVDMAVPYLAIMGFLFLADPTNRRRHLLQGSLIFIAFMLGQTLLRLWYYGDLLPNTYYLKMTGASALLRIIRGLFVYVKVAWNFNIVLFLLPFALIIIRPSRQNLLLAAVFAAMSLYSIYVGGDAWEHRGGANRFVSVVMPLYFVLLSWSFETIRRALIAAFASPSAWTNRLSQVILLGFAMIGLVNFNALLDTSSLKEWLLIERHGFVPGSERYVRISLVLNEITTAEASVGIVTAGIIPYVTDRYSLDMMGKADAVIAHEPMQIRDGMALIDFRPGHMKWNYAYSIGELNPDVVAQIWDGYDNPENLKYLTEYTRVNINGFPFFLRNDSANVQWDQVERLKE
jgi:arabinofuranosyltransferase